MAELGVPELEVGFPGIGEDEIERVRTIVELQLPFRTLGWGRAREEDLRAAARAGTDGFHFSLPVSGRHREIVGLSESQVLDAAERLATLAAGSFAYFSVGFQDASRADGRFLADLLAVVEATGARRVRIADTVGAWHPLLTHERIRDICARTTMEVEFHGHNDLGMAVANSVAAVVAGARAVSVTVNGMGERAGNAALEAVAMALVRSAGIDLKLDLGRLTSVCGRVAEVAGGMIQERQPVVGAATFRHEAGIHTQGILRDPDSYELVHPHEVGQSRPPFLVGTHSGSAGLQAHLAALGISLGRTEARRLLPRLRAFAEAQGRCLRDNELLELVSTSDSSSG